MIVQEVPLEALAAAIAAEAPGPARSGSLADDDEQTG